MRGNTARPSAGAVPIAPYGPRPLSPFLHSIEKRLEPAPAQLA